MLKDIITQQNNILSYKTTERRAALAPNEYVELAVSYKDKLNQPLFKRRLIWRIVEGEAVLRQPTTLTNGKGEGINYIKVPLDDPDAQVAIRLAVWPQDEPGEELEIDCIFGAPSIAPAVTDGPVLQTVFPRNDASGKTKITSKGASGTQFHLLNANANGDLIDDGSSINYQVKDTTNNISKSTKLHNNFLYQTSSNKYQESGKSTLTISYEDLKNSSYLTIESIDLPTMQVNNFWPPNGSVLQPGVTYPLRSLYTGGNGAPFPGCDILWSLVDDTSYSSLVGISPSKSKTDSDGIAVSTIVVDNVPYGMSGEVKLRVSLDGSTEGATLAFDYPTFTIGGQRFTDVQPDASKTGPISAANGIDFSVTLQDEKGSPMQGQLIQWIASSSRRSSDFQPWASWTGTDGTAKSTLTDKGIPQGTVETVDVRITSSGGALYTGSYQVYANTITQITPPNAGPFAVGDTVTVQVKVTDLDQKPVASEILTVTSLSDYITVSDQNPRTSSEGIATFTVKADTAINSGVLVAENPGVTVPTNIPLNFTALAAIIITPPSSANMRYDTWLPLKAKLTGKNGQPASNATLTWSCTNGAELENATTKTDSYGVSNNRIRYETLKGRPATPATTQLTVTADDGTSTTQTLTFTKSSLYNNLTLIGPKSGTQLPIDQTTVVTLQLTNQFDHALANYPMSWDEPSDDAVVVDFDPMTDAQGYATATVKGTTTGLAQFDANAPLALAHCDFTYEYNEVALPDYSVLIGRNYAHNPSEGNGVDPSEDSQTVLYTFRYLSENIPQPGKEVLWYFSPRTPDLRFFDSQNKAVQVDSSGSITTETDGNGCATLKIGSLTRFCGTISIAPKNVPSAGAFEYTFVIATFDSGDFDQNLMPVIFNPNPIAIPDSPTVNNPGFTLKIQKPQSYLRGQNVVFWNSTNAPGNPAQENVQVVSIEEAIFDGVEVPYAHVYPDPDQKGYNLFSYMIVNPTTSNTVLSRPVVPTVTGNATSNHPDYNNTNRTLPAPHLNNYANVINGNSIVYGLDIYIPYSSTWTSYDCINLMIYLNGESESGEIIGNTIPYLHNILPSDVSGKNDIIIHIPQDMLSGYRDGTFESDYYIGNNWSLILENVALDTAEWQ